MAVEIETMSGTPLNALIIAINHYISTHEFIGSGHALPTPDGEGYTVVIPVNRKNETDLRDWEKLHCRFVELEGENEIPFTLETLPDNKNPEFSAGLLTVKKEDVPRLTERLREKPGALGWGSLYEFIKPYGLTNEN